MVGFGLGRGRVLTGAIPLLHDVTRIAIETNVVSRAIMRVRPNVKVSDGSQPPMTFDFYCELNGWLPFAAPTGSPFLVWPSSWTVAGRVYQSPLSSR